MSILVWPIEHLWRDLVFSPCRAGLKDKGKGADVSTQTALYADSVAIN